MVLPAISHPAQIIVTVQTWQVFTFLKTCQVLNYCLKILRAFVAYRRFFYGAF